VGGCEESAAALAVRAALLGAVQGRFGSSPSAGSGGGSDGRLRRIVRKAVSRIRDWDLVLRSFRDAGADDAGLVVVEGGSSGGCGAVDRRKSANS
jgi:hypothetical protein